MEKVICHTVALPSLLMITLIEDPQIGIMLTKSTLLHSNGIFDERTLYRAGHQLVSCRGLKYTGCFSGRSKHGEKSVAVMYIYLMPVG